MGSKKRVPGSTGGRKPLGRVTRPENKYIRRACEKEVVRDMRAQSKEGSVIQRQEARTFNPENGGSNPSRPTNILVAKQCSHCKGQAMHIHQDGELVRFSGCEPCIVDIRIERVGMKEALIKGRRSTKCVRCSNCHRKHLLSSFTEVKDGTANVSGA